LYSGDSSKSRRCFLQPQLANLDKQLTSCRRVIWCLRCRDEPRSSQESDLHNTSKCTDLVRSSIDAQWSTKVAGRRSHQIRETAVTNSPHGHEGEEPRQRVRRGEQPVVEQVQHGALGGDLLHHGQHPAGAVQRTLRCRNEMEMLPAQTKRERATPCLMCGTVRRTAQPTRPTQRPSARSHDHLFGAYSTQTTAAAFST
jgi:hypothetical protein